MRTTLPLWLLFGLGAFAGVAAPSPEVTADAVTLSDGRQTLTISRQDATLTLRGPGLELTLQPSLQEGTGWTRPQPAVAPPVVTQKRGNVGVRITFPVSEEREFVLLADVYRDLPGVFVTSQLRVLGSARGQYYYWQSSLGSAHYFAPHHDPERVAFSPDAWDTIAWRPWWFVPQGAGGVALMPTNDGGRGPGPAGRIFLHALPRSNLIGTGDSLDAGFGLNVVGDAAAAQAWAAQVQPRALPALTPGARARQDWDYGPAAPKWLREAEVYNLYYRDKAQWTPENVARLRGFPFIIGSTPDKAALDRCHAAGIKLLHYVVYTCLLDTGLQVRDGGRVYSEWTESLDCETRDLKDHPDWVCLAPDGQPQHDAWGQAHGHPGQLNTCLHQEGLKQAAVRQVRMLMELGYDGVFIDLAGPTVECHGAKLGKHTHPHPEWTNTRAYEDVLRAIYAEVKRHGRDRVVIQNTCTGLMPDHWAYCDSQMLEAFPYGEGSLTLRATPPELEWNLRRHAPAVAAGKVPVLLSYFGAGEPEGLKRAAWLSRVYAALAGFLWADAFGLREVKGLEEFTPGFYAARLGRAAGPVSRDGDLLSRRFAGGTARLNPYAWRAPEMGPQTGEWVGE